MMNFSKWFSALAGFVLLAGPAVAGDAIAAGKVKGVDADKKEFVLTDSAGKDWTFRLGDTVIINRAGKESQSYLSAGDPVNVCYDRGLLTLTAHYILVQEGEAKNRELYHGSVKNYDADKKEVTITDETKAWTFPMGDAKVRLNREDSKIGDIKIGDKALAIVEKIGEVKTLKCLMIERR
jgi:Cu/Ag efflux protein CusF